MSSPGPSLPSRIFVDKELSLVYDPQYFYPVHPREVFAGHYSTLIKVCWGISLIEEPETIVELEIANSNASSIGHKHKVEQHISIANPLHLDRSLIQIFLDSFRVKGLLGQYVFVPYIPTYKRTIIDISVALQGQKNAPVRYLSASTIISNTKPSDYLDLKLENIMVLFKDLTSLTDFMDVQAIEKPKKYNTACRLWLSN
ncbi:hypothetical protein N7478_000245 [Penicillium angulare]|uniref:uncharacterized protein n=1 Tax=Penicillium angulare TaxID=116970 RepID=UPI00254019E7|nr:uncharacterized protein N7478_000245 [Penicillium angulare]KAJ5290994.1 hypothetical protein N7478_000245 [Penicillium angulare]